MATADRKSAALQTLCASKRSAICQDANLSRTEEQVVRRVGGLSRRLSYGQYLGLRHWHALWGEERFTVVFVTHSVFESVFLSNRIVVMGARPGRVFDEVAVDVPYPRNDTFRTSSDYAALCRQTSDVLVDAINATSGQHHDGH